MRINPPICTKIGSASGFKSADNDLNNYLKNLGLIEFRHELLLVRNTFIKKELKSANKLNKSIESIMEKINPQGNPYPSPYPYRS